MKAGWQVKALGEVVRLEYGKPLPDDQRNANGKFSVYGANGEKSRSDLFLAKGPSLIIGRKGSAGEINLANEDFWPLDVTYFTQHDPKQIELGFLHFALSMLDLPSMARGVKPGINRNDVYELTIPLPPLAEQKQIVAVLDAAFAGLSRARAHVLANLDSARELFDRTVDSVFNEISTLHHSHPIGEIANCSLGKMLDKSKNKGSPRPYLRNVNVRWFQIDRDDLLQMRIQDSEVERYAVRKGDLLICEGGYPGRASIWDEDEPIFFQKALHRVRFANPVHNRLLMYFLYSKDASGELKQYFSGTGIQHFTGASLAKMPFPFPSVSHALLAVSKIEAMREASLVAEAHYRAKLADLDALRAALLQKAFAGELT